MTGEAARTLRAEDEVSHYRIVGPLGAGGMGEVYLAQDSSLERRVALKILPPDLVRSEERVRRFVLEAKSASSLSHPNIVTIYEIGEAPVRSPGEPASDPVHFISMELVSGQTLATLIHDEGTDLRTLLGYLAQAADGLAKAHAAGIVHRDLKPGNIMVSSDGFAKVLDFGLAKLTETREPDPGTSAAQTVLADTTREGMVVGTAGYMSPEQVQGRAVDARSDVFSFGCILYEAATRRRPFVAETTIDTLHKILNERPVPVEELNPRAPAELRRLIRRCLAKSPDQRLQSMKDLALELRDIVEEYDSLPPSGSSGSLASVAAAAPPARRRRGALIAVLGVAALLALIAVAWGLWRAQRAARSQPFQTMQMTPVTSRGDVTECALSADGRYLAYLAGSAGQLSLRVRQVGTGGDVEVVPTSGAGLQSPSFSPDGDYLYYLARKPDAQNYRVLYQVPSLGGAPVQRAFDVDSRVSFSPDGKRIAFWRGVAPKEENHLVVLDLETGKERLLAVVASPEFVAGAPDWSPDGQRIAAALIVPTGLIRSVVALFDVASGRRQDHVTLPLTQIRDLTWLRDGKGIVVTAWATLSSLDSQVFLVGYPGRDVQHVTNDFSQYSGASVSGGEEAIAAVRQTALENVWVADVPGGAVRQVTNVGSAENSLQGLAAADSSTLLYSAPRGDGFQVWALSLSGGEPQPLTSGSGLSFRALGGGGRITYTRAGPEGLHVWCVDGDGSGARQLTSGSGEQVGALSPDGSLLAFRSFDAPGVCRLMRLDNGQTSALASDVSGVLGFSSDGRRLLVGRNEPDPGGLTRVRWLAFAVPEGTLADSLRLPGQAANPRWAADGRGLLYQDATDPARNVWRQDFAGGPPTQLTRFDDGRITDFLPSPDGRHLAIARRAGPAHEVWLAGSDGRGATQLTRLGAGRVFEMQWLPDGRRLAIGAGSLSSDAVLIRRFR